MIGAEYVRNFSPAPGCSIIITRVIEGKASPAFVEQQGCNSAPQIEEIKYLTQTPYIKEVILSEETDYVTYEHNVSI